MLNIARNIYSAWNLQNQKNSLSEAEVIPIGESANEKKKLITITRKYSNLMEYENIPLPGFTLFKTDRKNWGSIDQTWLIIDPRGFLVRISNNNLENILHVTGITEGLIQEQCVWAREDSQTKMTLVPVSSPLYIEAVKNTELIEGKIDMKDVQIGDTVLLQNKLQGIYMGIASLYGALDSYVIGNEYKAQTYLRRQIIEISDGKYHYQTDLKILKVIEKSKISMTREESAIKINERIAKGGTFFTNSTNMNSGYYSARGMIKHVSIHTISKISMTFEEITKIEATHLFHSSQLNSDFGQLLIENSNQNRFLIDFPYSYQRAPVNPHAFHVCELVNSFHWSPNGELEKTEKIYLKDSRKYWSATSASPGQFSLDKFTKFYKIVKHVKNDSYV